MIPIKVYEKINNLKIDNVNFGYGFKFYICMLSKIITSVIIQIVPLFMFSPIHVSQQDVKLPLTFIFHFGGNLVENILGDKLKTNKTIIVSLIDKVFASSKEECQNTFLLYHH
jgi:hypothetical protein